MRAMCLALGFMAAVAIANGARADLRIGAAAKVNSALNATRAETTTGRRSCTVTTAMMTIAVLGRVARSPAL